MLNDAIRAGFIADAEFRALHNRSSLGELVLILDLAAHRVEASVSVRRVAACGDVFRKEGRTVMNTVA